MGGAVVTELDGVMVSSEIAAFVARLKSVIPDVDLKRLAFLVSHDEWQAMEKAGDYYAPRTTMDERMPMVRLTVAGMLVLKWLYEDEA
jgi:hypothetical protein